MSRLMCFANAVVRDPAVDRWLGQQATELGPMAEHWFNVMRGCGHDVRELLHDGHPTACVEDAAFCYVNAFTAHVNIGFFLGAEMPDPYGLMEGSGKFMRHVKLRPDTEIETSALTYLIEYAYTDMKGRLAVRSLD